MKRAVVVFGAGASVEYGAPSTGSLTHANDGSVIADAGMKLVKAVDAFKTIKAGLETCLENPGIVHFEHIYHCAHELISTFAPTAGAARRVPPEPQNCRKSSSIEGCQKSSESFGTFVGI
jgi:hypothetical protein